MPNGTAANANAPVASVTAGPIGVPWIVTVAPKTGPAALVTAPVKAPAGAAVSARSWVAVSPATTVTAISMGGYPKADAVTV